MLRSATQGTIKSISNKVNNYKINKNENKLSRHHVIIIIDFKVVDGFAAFDYSRQRVPCVNSSNSEEVPPNFTISTGFDDVSNT